MHKNSLRVWIVFLQANKKNKQMIKNNYTSKLENKLKYKFSTQFICPLLVWCRGWENNSSMNDKNPQHANMYLCWFYFSLLFCLLLASASTFSIYFAFQAGENYLKNGNKSTQNQYFKSNIFYCARCLFFFIY